MAKNTCATPLVPSTLGAGGRQAGKLPPLPMPLAHEAFCAGVTSLPVHTLGGLLPHHRCAPHRSQSLLLLSCAAGGYVLDLTSVPVLLWDILHLPALCVRYSVAKRVMHTSANLHMPFSFHLKTMGKTTMALRAGAAGRATPSALTQ